VEIRVKLLLVGIINPSSLFRHAFSDRNSHCSWYYLPTRRFFKFSEGGCRTKNESKSAQASPTREDKSVTAIKPGDLDLTDVSLTKQSNGEWVLKGTIVNDSEFDLASINFLVTDQDCPEQQGCKTIGQERTVTNTSIVPSHQVRLFNTYPIRFLDCLRRCILDGNTRSS
jgi:hypothetical protein